MHTRDRSGAVGPIAWTNLARGLRHAAKTTIEPFFRLGGGAHARRLDEALGGIVDAASDSASGRMNIELGGFHLPFIRRHPWRQWQFVMNRPGMIRQHLLGIIDLAIIHDATQK